MHIGLSSTTIEPYLTDGKIDGIGTYTTQLYEEFQKTSLDTRLIAFRNNGITNSAYPNGELLNYSYSQSTLMATILPFSSFIYGKAVENLDLFHATDHMIPRLNIPVVATIHDALMFQYPKWFGNTRFSSFKKRIRFHSLKWPNHFITVSQSMVDELVKYCGVPEKKISVVYNGISPFWHTEVSSDEKENVLNKFHLPKKFVLFTGTLHPKKNLPALVNAFLKLPLDLQKEYPLVVVGREGWSTEESLSAIQQLKEKGVGCWLNYVTLEELRVLFQSAAAYLHPSLHEGFGLTLVQAFASRTPVLTSNVTAMPEIAGDAALLVDPLSESEITAGIQNILTTDTLREKLIEKGTQRARDFSWEKCAFETIKIYREVLS